MAISYLSKQFTPSPYVSPVDLNLLARVNAYKQSVFYKNAENFKNQLTQIKNSDILNKEQAALLKDKYNNLATQIQGMSGIDYSDMNISNTLTGYAGTIYEDENIMKGISSTKQIRQLHSNYEKMKADPKLMKFYGVQNEWWDNRAVNDYVNGGISASYTGSSSPTLYNGNPYSRLTAELKRLKPDIEVGYDYDTKNPYFYNKISNEILSPDKIYADLQGQLSPDILNQIKIDSNYRMQGVKTEDLEKAIVERHDQSIKEAEANIAEMERRKVLSTNTNDEEHWTKQIELANTDLTKRKNNFNLADLRNSLKTEEGQISAKTDIGLQSIMDSAVKAYTYKKISNVLQFNLAAAHQDKMQIEREKLLLAQQKLALDAAKAAGKDKATGTGADMLSGIYDFSSNTQDENELVKGEKLTEKNINTNVLALEEEISTELKTFLIENKGEKYQQYFAKLSELDGKAGLSVRDLRLGAGIENGNPLRLAKDARDFFWSAADAIDKTIGGDIGAVNNTTFNRTQFANVANNIGKRQAQIEYYQAVLEDGKKAVKNEMLKDLSVQEKGMYDYLSQNRNKFIKNEGKVTSYTGGSNLLMGTVNTSPSYDKLSFDFSSATANQQKLLNSIVKKLKLSPYNLDNVVFDKNKLQKYLDNESFREVYKKEALDWEKVGGAFQSFLSDNKLVSNIDVKSIKPTHITPIPTSSPEYADGKRYKVDFQYGSGEKTNYSQRLMTDEQALKVFGIQSINARFERVLNYKKKLPIQFNEIKFKDGTSQVVQAQVTRPAGQGGTTMVNIWDGKDWIQLRQIEGLPAFATAEQAEYIASKLINAQNAYNTFNDYITEIKRYANQ